MRGTSSSLRDCGPLEWATAREVSNGQVSRVNQEWGNGEAMHGIEMEMKCREILRGLRAVRPSYEHWTVELRHDSAGEPYVYVAVRRGQTEHVDQFPVEYLEEKPQDLIRWMAGWAHANFGTGPLPELP